MVVVVVVHLGLVAAVTVAVGHGRQAHGECQGGHQGGQQ
jgi:hypothetical protein